jgi:hypothetical protein
MKLEPDRTVILSSITFFALVLAGTMGWVIALHELQSQETLVKELIAIGMEVLKVVVIAAAAAIAVERFLEHKSADDPGAVLSKAGILEIYPKRQDANEEFLRCARDENVRNITISGISLRDFLLSNGILHHVWRDLCTRLKREQDNDFPTQQRLHVRLLFLHPSSDEGSFRHAVETADAIHSIGIPYDIPQALGHVRRAQQEIFGGDTVFLEARLYEHCPFAFLFATDRHVFVEQYDYRNQHEPAAMPLLCYNDESLQYKEQMFSLEVIWKHAQSAEALNQVGTAPAIRGAQIRNIFRGEHYHTGLIAHQVNAIRRANGKSIDILTIAGPFYTSNHQIAPQLQRISAPTATPTGEICPGIPIRFAIINPVSQQAILRAVADETPPEEVPDRLLHWNWAFHQQSALYKNSRSTAHTLSSWKKQRGCEVSVKVYSSSISCMILQTDKQAFVEHYMYGRSKAFSPGVNLGGEYPVIEYDLTDAGEKDIAEHQIISSTFEAIWKFYSIDWEDYVTCDEENEFDLNLARLRAELRLSTPSSEIRPTRRTN